MATGQFEMEPGEIDPYGYVIAAIGFACFTHFYGSIKVRYHTQHSRCVDSEKKRSLTFGSLPPVGEPGAQKV